MYSIQKNPSNKFSYHPENFQRILLQLDFADTNMCTDSLIKLVPCLIQSMDHASVVGENKNHFPPACRNIGSFSYICVLQLLQELWPHLTEPITTTMPSKNFRVKRLLQSIRAAINRFTSSAVTTKRKMLDSLYCLDHTNRK